jgi:hypothetical protein
VDGFMRSESKLRARICHLILAKNNSKKYPSPSGCPTDLVKAPGEMITKILHLIQSTLLRFRPQRLFQSQSAKQEEFCFLPKNQPPTQR